MKTLCVILVLFLWSAEIMMSDTSRFQARADSLSALAENPQTPDGKRAQVYGQLAWLVRDAFPVKGLEYVRQSIYYAEKAHDMHEKAQSLSYMGVIHRKMGNYSEALTCFYDQLSIGEESNDSVQIAYAFNNLCDIYKYFGNHEKAVDFGRKALVIFDRLQHTVGLGYTYIRLSQALQGLDGTEKYAEIIRLLHKALALRQSLGDQNAISNCMVWLSGAYLGADNVVQAEYYAMSAIDIARGIDGDRTLLFSAILAQARIREFQKQWKVSAQQAQYVADSAHALGFRQLYIEALKLLVRNAVVRQNLSRLTVLQEQLLMMKDSSFLETTTQKSLTMESEYNFHRTEAQIRQLQAEQVWTQRIVVGVSVALIIMVGIAFAFMRLTVKARRAERALNQQRRATDELNKKLQDINTELQNTNQDLSKANQFKMQLLSIAAHDLRNPLTSILGMAEMIEQGILQGTDTQTFAGHIHTAGTRMVKLIKDLLESSSLELQNISLTCEPMDVSIKTAQIINDIRPAAIAKHQTIHCDWEEQCMVSADHDRLHQAIENILSNAIKYSPEHSAIMVRIYQIPNHTVHHAQKQHRIDLPLIRIEIQDQGQGLTKDDIQRMFGMFQRLSAQPTKGESSTGVGLFIVHHIITLHHGAVWAESPGQGLGATFIIELPALKVQD